MPNATKICNNPAFLVAANPRLLPFLRPPEAAEFSVMSIPTTIHLQLTPVKVSDLALHTSATAALRDARTG
jgi:hypothetical protein